MKTHGRSGSQGRKGELLAIGLERHPRSFRGIKFDAGGIAEWA